MTKAHINQTSFLLSLGVIAYVSVVAWVMQHAHQWFGQEDTMIGAIAFLMLFVISAAVVGGFVVGYPAYWFFNGQKKESIQLLVTTVSCLIGETILILLTLALRQG